jgi:hypothetical protein
MKAALFTGMLVLLLLAAPAQTYALGLAEYGQEVAKADQPVLQLPRLNTLAEYFRGWQPGRAAHSFRRPADGVLAGPPPGLPEIPGESPPGRATPQVRGARRRLLTPPPVPRPAVGPAPVPGRLPCVLILTNHIN